MLYLFISSFILWAWMFRGFLTGRLMIMGDAIAYYDHTKFFLDNLGRGILPLWDPHWNCGVPNEFFLRRLGEYNPFYALVVIFQKCGLPYYNAYFLFLFLYLLLGMIGFTFLLWKLFHDRRVAFVGFMLFLFSTFPTMLFRSFVLLLFVPIVWFFAFMLDFHQRPSKGAFAGVIFALMLIVITYLPFFFMSIFLFYAVFQVLLFPKATGAFFKKLFSFCLRQKVFAVLMLIVFGLALIPGISYYLQGQNADFALPVRHHLSESKNVFEVPAQSVVVGGILAHTVKDMLFSNLKDIEVSRIYAPIFAYALFFLGLGIKINRRVLHYFLIGLCVYMIGLHEASPLYNFLYKTVFIFRYFRNFQFYIWLVHVPVFVLISCAFFKTWLGWIEQEGKSRKIGMALYAISHMFIFLLLVFTQEKVVATSYVSLVLSLGLGLFWLWRGAKPSRFFLPLIFIAIICQPLQVYYHLDENSKEMNGAYLYDGMDQEFSFFREGERSVGRKTEEVLNRTSGKKGELYYVTGWISYLRDNVDYATFRKYTAYKFLVYDSVRPIGFDTIDFKRVQEALNEFKNVAFIYPPKEIPELSPKKTAAPQALKIKGNSDALRVIDHNANFVEVETHFDQPKFLVFNDSFFKGWQAYLNGKPHPLYRANVAFKGVYLPKGRNVVKFAFGTTKNILSKIALSVVFWFALIYCVRLYYVDFRSGEEKVS